MVNGTEAGEEKGKRDNGMEVRKREGKRNELRNNMRRSGG